MSDFKRNDKVSIEAIFIEDAGSWDPINESPPLVKVAVAASSSWYVFPVEAVKLVERHTECGINYGAFTCTRTKGHSGNHQVLFKNSQGEGQCVNWSDEIMAYADALRLEVESDPSTGR